MYWLFLILALVVFFFFKQKTAYEVRISDWSSDVCSSDLIIRINHDSALTSAVDPRSAILLPETCPLSLEQNNDTFATSATHSTHVATVFAMQDRLIIRINHYSALTSAVDPRSAILLPETCPFSREHKLNNF